MSAITLKELVPKPRKKITLDQNRLITKRVIENSTYSEECLFLKIPKKTIRQLGVRSYGTSHNWELKITLERRKP